MNIINQIQNIQFSVLQKKFSILFLKYAINN